MRLSRFVLGGLAVLSPIVSAQSSSNNTSLAASTTPNNSSLQVITTTITSLVTPTASGSRSASPTTFVLTLTVNSTTFPDGSTTNSTVNGNTTLANSTEPWKEGDDSIPFMIKIDPAFGVLGALLILSGIPVAILGGKMRWSSVAIASAYSLMLFTLVLILRFGVEPAMQPPSPQYPSTTLRGLYLLACVIASFFGAAAGIFFFNFSKYWVSAAGGFVFGWFLLATREGGLITSVLGRWGLLGSLTIVAFLGALVPVLHDHMVLISTAWIGATAFVLGVDCYTRAGLKEFYIYNLGYRDLFPKLNGGKYPLTQTMIIELGILAAVVLIGAAVQFKLLDILRHRLKQQRDEEEAKVEAEEVAQAAERFKNVGAELNEWEEKHGANSPRALGTPESAMKESMRDDRSSIHLPALGFDQHRQGKTSSTASLLMRTDRNSTYNAMPAVTSSNGNTPTTLNFSNLGLEEMLSSAVGQATQASDPELESKLKLLEEVQRARESVHSSLEKIRAGTPTPTLGTDRSPTTSAFPARPTSALASSVDLRPRRGSTSSSRVLESELPRPTTISEWDYYVQSRNVITPPVALSPGLGTAGTMQRGSSFNSQYAVVSDSVARAVDRRERTTSMMDLSASDQWGPRETLASAPQHTSMGRRTMSFHEQQSGRVQQQDSYRAGEPANDPTRTRHSSGPRAMTYEELSDRHRRRISALQDPVTAKIREPLEIANAKAEWERQKRLERSEMQRREAERQAMMKEREKRGPAVEKTEVLKSTDEWRRSIAGGLDKMASPAYPAAAATERRAPIKKVSHRASTHFAN